LGILTGDIRSTNGEAYVAGHDITGRTPGAVGKARRCMGFCPQIDPLLDLMTGRETLRMFGSLKGIPNLFLDETIDDLLDALSLSPHADKPSCTYSGGNKRKLSLGIAIIGDPDVLFIDEASSGMDPVSSRKMWALINKISERRSVVLTTHSMEEAEALCTRVGIMTSGRMRCLGSVQHLKNKFLPGSGYTVDVMCESDVGSDVVDRLEREILDHAFRGSLVTERHGSFLRFDTPFQGNRGENGDASRLDLGNLFQLMQNLKEDPMFRIEDYSISQCTLEQVFLNLAKENDDQITQNPLV